MIDFFGVKRVHFLGVGGVSMSSLALFLHKNGVAVSGTDAVFSEKLSFLQTQGVDVWTGFLPERTGKPDAYVYTAAVPSTDTERCYLDGIGVPCAERKELLGAVSKKFRYVVAVAGTHGKTTTTAMIASVLFRAGKKLYAHIGGTVPDLPDFLYTGNDYFVCEACEYNRSLLCLRPNIAVLLNAEFDHPDVYRNLEEIYETFRRFLTANKNCVPILNGDDPFHKTVAAPNTRLFSYEGTDYRIERTKEYENNCFGCEITYFGRPIYEIRLSVPGRYNLQNAAACCAVCHLLGIEKETVEQTLSSFRGVKRRFEKRGETHGVPVYSDYAHHPTEIAAALTSARSVVHNGRIFAVFQPHTYSRTAALCKEFIAALKADFVLLVKEYPARETPERGMTSKALFRRLPCKNKEYFDTFLSAASYLVNRVLDGDLILILGAGDVDILADMLTDSFPSSAPTVKF